MNSSKKNLTSSRIEAFFGGLSEFVSSLPTRQDKHKIDRDLDVVISFLSDFKNRIGNLPTSEDAEGVNDAIDRLRDYIHMSESSPAISSALGIGRSRTRSRSRRSVFVSFNLSDEVDILRGLDSEDIRTRFQEDKKFTVARLRMIGDEMGVRTTTNATRREIIEQIIVHLRNESGYELLRSRS